MSEMLLTITDLVRIKSTADRPAELLRAIAYVENYFKNVDGIVIRHYESNGKPSIVVSFSDALDFDVALVGHLDVVPAADELFEPHIDGAIMRGRGTCDMKSEIAVMMELMCELASQRPSIALMLGCDEEVGGMNGIGYLVKTIGYRARVALVPDGGESPDAVVLKSKGVLHITVNAQGVAAHGSRPWLGDNAIEKLFAAYQRIHALFPASDDPDHWHSTCVLGKFTGGMVVNQVPDKATCEIDIRIAEDVSPEALLERVRESVSDIANVQLLCCGKYTVTDWNDPYLTAYQEAVREVLHTELHEEITHGATDGRFFSELGIPVITSRPVSGGQHTPQEWVDMNSLLQFKSLYKDAIGRFTAVSH